MSISDPVPPPMCEKPVDDEIRVLQAKAELTKAQTASTIVWALTVGLFLVLGFFVYLFLFAADQGNIPDISDDSISLFAQFKDIFIAVLEALF